MNGKMDLLVGKYVNDMEVNKAYSSLPQWEAIAPSVETQFKYKRSFKKSENTLHAVERKKFALCALVFFLENACKRNHFLIKLKDLGLQIN